MEWWDYKVDSNMSAKKHLLKALDASWVYEDAKLMQQIADALDRAEQIESKTEEPAEKNTGASSGSR